MSYCFRCKEWRAARWNYPLPNNEMMGGAPCVLFVFGIHVFFHVGKKTSHRSGEHFG